MQLKDVIKELEKEYPNYKQFDFYYHMDIYDTYTKDIVFPEEFIGVSSYHDYFLDTSEDPDGWSLEDEVKSYHVCKNAKKEIERGEIPVSILLEPDI